MPKRRDYDARAGIAHPSDMFVVCVLGCRRDRPCHPRRLVAARVRTAIPVGSLSAHLSAHHRSLDACGRLRAQTDTAGRWWLTSNNDLLTPTNADECTRRKCPESKTHNPKDAGFKSRPRH